MDLTLENLLAWKGIAVAIWFAGFFLLERLFPAAPYPDGRGKAAPKRIFARLAISAQRVIRNLGLWLLNTGLSPLVVLPLSVWAASHALDWRPQWWAGLPGLALDLVILDFLIYWWHRANHELPFLWRFHEVHHLDGFLDSSSALRFHFGEVLLSATARAGVIILLGFPVSSILVFEVLVLLASIFHHSNLRLPSGLETALSRLFITPSIHWVHHHKVRRDTDSNYGTIFSFWDPLFGSRSSKVRSPNMPIGVEREDERPYLTLLLRPFRLRG
ncbi:sterol desaturase family protein [Fodinicurvata fenggangensis]|uniref:sterol desaturase family protein n=1 Tax=Fodinicurvata fenggangensis TaxID=1121830 RepID=UPI000556A6C3|nr:sterol desaturase family protein [Fodinicurvata fenggangensis]